MIVCSISVTVAIETGGTLTVEGVEAIGTTGFTEATVGVTGATEGGGTATGFLLSFF